MRGDSTTQFLRQHLVRLEVKRRDIWAVAEFVHGGEDRAVGFVCSVHRLTEDAPHLALPFGQRCDYPCAVGLR